MTNLVSFICFSILFLCFNLTAISQTASTTINLILTDVLSIEPISAANGGVVDFHYNTVADYNSEKTATIANSLIITFSKPFDIKVKANGANFENGTNNIPIDVMTVQRNANSTISGISTPIVLSTQDQVLISAANLGAKLKLDLDYIIPAARSSSSDILGKPAGSYIQTVTYTASAL